MLATGDTGARLRATVQLQAWRACQPTKKRHWVSPGMPKETIISRAHPTLSSSPIAGRDRG